MAASGRSRQDRLEPFAADHQTADPAGLGDDRRRSRPLPEHGQLAEVVAGLVCP